jgi:hypothetical protein
MRSQLFGNAAAVLVALVAFEAISACRSSAWQPAIGQTAAGPESQVILGTVQGSGNEPYVFIYEVPSKRLCAYTVKNGVEIRGARECTYDFQLHDLTNIVKRLSPADIKAMLKP